jgi:septal ring factor EnvC (AmiA/AmiB activator)
VRWLAGIGAGALLVAALGYLIADQVQARHQFDRAQASLGATRQHTATVSTQLAGLRRQLAHLTAQIGDDTTALTQDASQLKGAQSALAAAQAHVTLQASHISSLQACLGGVERALNALAVGKRARAITALKAVSSSCAAAAASGD